MVNIRLYFSVKSQKFYWKQILCEIKKETWTAPHLTSSWLRFQWSAPVSYTHLDVYKRQLQPPIIATCIHFRRLSRIEDWKSSWIYCAPGSILDIMSTLDRITQNRLNWSENLKSELLKQSPLQKIAFRGKELIRTKIIINN